MARINRGHCPVGSFALELQRLIISQYNNTKARGPAGGSGRLKHLTCRWVTEPVVIRDNVFCQTTTELRVRLHQIPSPVQYPKTAAIIMSRNDIDMIFPNPNCHTVSCVMSKPIRLGTYTGWTNRRGGTRYDVMVSLHHL